MAERDEAGFRQMVRDFIAAALTPDIRDAPALGGLMIDLSAQQRWHKALAARGWAVPSWPVEYGGTGWSDRELHAFHEEMGRARAPALSSFLNMVGPVIYTFGTPEQKAQHLPPLVAGETLWCQGYSEPGSGSDLASLKTRAERQGEHYVVNGQKIWTSYAHEANWMFCLVRTSTAGKPQTGISFLLIDMTTPGIEVRPIVSIDGLHHLNEVFFRDVKVPVANRIGEENRGWDYAKFLLLHERSTISNVPLTQAMLGRARRLAGQIGDGGSLSRRLDEIEVRLLSFEVSDLRNLARLEAGEALGAETSLFKVINSEISQAIEEAAVEALGPHANILQVNLLTHPGNQAPLGPDGSVDVTPAFLFGRASSIYGGSNEIQRNVLSKAVLGL
ncbi:acyl-CoA dehydrogenase family protein [Zavarzinia sp. CC-PAN008]|uniref:acyl-CoA dehydrogenase family protein n=1 Tax=Zavarzinia sp. CC-PAN008 TaxID=3243332 RepID=UPI003F744829